MRWLMTLQTLSRIALALSGLGTIVIITAAIAQLAQQGLTRELWLTLGGLVMGQEIVTRAQHPIGRDSIQHNRRQHRKFLGHLHP
jgi:hypothetical protein